MPTADRRAPLLLALLLAGLVVGLPWAEGGRSPAGQVGLLLAACLGAAIGLCGGRSGPGVPPPSALLAALLIGLSAARSIYPDRTLQSLLLLAAYLLVAGLARRLVREAPALEGWLLLAGLASGVVVAGMGMVTRLQGGDGGLYADLLVGPFGYPNAAAGFLLLAAGAGLTLAALLGPGPRRLSALAAGAVPLAGLLLTRSRGALLAAGAGGCVWVALAWPLWGPRRRLWGGRGGLLAAAALLLWTAPRWTALLSRGPAALDSSAAWRLSILARTWEMIRDQPWLGVGPGAFPVALPAYQRLPYLGGINPHDLYLEVAAEYGLPVGLLFALGLLLFLARLAARVRRLPPEGERRLLQPLLATLAAGAVHLAVDLGGSVPAIVTLAALLGGLAAGHLPPRPPRPERRRPGLRRAAFALALLALTGLALARYSASLLTASGRAALTWGDSAAARADLERALVWNPLSYPAREGLTRALLAAGEAGRAAEVASQTTRLAPRDPNGHHLLGEALLAGGRFGPAEARFERAVELAPAAQLRFHAGLVEAAALGGHAAEARWHYRQALARFSPDRVLADEARCLAPGDRYLLARMGRLVAPLYLEAGQAESARQAAAEAERLARPDPRGICVTRGRPGRRSPEEALVAYWESRGDSVRARLVRIAFLAGGEWEAVVGHQLSFQSDRGETLRCGVARLRFTPEGWILAGHPRLAPVPCTP